MTMYQKTGHSEEQKAVRKQAEDRENQTKDALEGMEALEGDLGGGHEEEAEEEAAAEDEGARTLLL